MSRFSGSHLLELVYGAEPPTSTDVLGAVRYGLPACTEDGMPCAPLALLPDGGATWSVWHSPGPATVGQHGMVRYRHNDHLLLGCVDVAESDFGVTQGRPPLQDLAHAAYRDIFDTLAATGFSHLVRCWNYLPAINRDDDGLERYRQFNIGRHDAFIAAAQSWQAGSPAASALGTDAGQVMLYFLASHAASLAIENPRQISAYDYPPEYGPRSPSFSRACLLGLPGEDVLFISGTASIVGHATLHAGNVAEQTRETLRNITAVVEQANHKAGAVAFSCPALTYKVFIRYAEDMPTVAAILDDFTGNKAGTLYLRADICRADLLVEIEAFGSRERM